MSQSPRIGAIIRIKTPDEMINDLVKSLNPLESGQSFEFEESVLKQAEARRSQSPRIGAIIRIPPKRYDHHHHSSGLNPLESGQSFE